MSKRNNIKELYLDPALFSTYETYCPGYPACKECPTTMSSTYLDIPDYFDPDELSFFEVESIDA